MAMHLGFLVHLVAIYNIQHKPNLAAACVINKLTKPFPSKLSVDVLVEPRQTRTHLDYEDLSTRPLAL